MENNIYKNLANKYYFKSSKFKKAFDAAVAIDNALSKDKSHFMIENYLKYFDYKVLKENNLL
jgi:hypothetical protein